MRKMINQLRKEDYTPEVIILDWTEILFFLPKLKKIWPNAKFVGIEEDVSYLGLQRKGKYYNNFFSRKFFQLKEKRVKKKEISLLNQANLAIFNNKKDLLLAQKDGFTGEYIVWSVYYQTFPSREINPNNNKNIVFYGSMSREENWKSCVWFIEKVLPLIHDKDIKFIIVGGNPNPKLLSYQSERVIIKGFVEDVGAELANSMCLVAPLVMGAGIKVKIIEAMSIGLPVITNDIGIEGIPAKDGEEYYYCSSPNDYSDVIERLCMNMEEAKKIGDNSKKMIVNTFNYHSDAVLFEEKIVNL
jgi:glycosyltransferase involved in cell wall biosynthesis